MIQEGKCGCFNPLLLECLSISAESILKISNGSAKLSIYDQINDIAGECFRHNELTSAKRTFNLLKHEKTVNKFFMTLSNELLFEYTTTPSVLTLTPAGARLLEVEEIVVNPFTENGSLAKIFTADCRSQLSELVRSSSPEKPEFEFECDLNIGGQIRHIRAICRSTWSIDDTLVYTGIIGKVVFGLE